MRFFLLFYIVVFSIFNFGSAFSNERINDFEEFDVIEDQDNFNNENQINSQPADNEVFNAEDDATIEEEIVETKPNNFEDQKQKPKLEFANVAVYKAFRWDKFYSEFLILIAIMVYFYNYILNRSRNQQLAESWFLAHKSALEEQFTLVGDNGKAKPSSEVLIKESENLYALWCSGRTYCEGMLVHIKLLKRHDFLSVLSYTLKSGMSDQIQLKITMLPGEMDSFVFCLAHKRYINFLIDDLSDIKTYCGERKSGDKFGLSNSLVLLSELYEPAASILFEQRVFNILNKFSHLLQYIHISDQYTGPKQLDNANKTSASTSVSCVINICYNIDASKSAIKSTNVIESTKPLLYLAFYLIDRVKRFRLSKEARAKTEKNRLKVQGDLLKQGHQQRAEKAQAKRDEKRRLEKEKIMQEEDPEKQRRLEEKLDRKEAKRNAPKMRQMKVKAL